MSVTKDVKDKVVFNFETKIRYKCTLLVALYRIKYCNYTQDHLRDTAIDNKDYNYYIEQMCFAHCINAARFFREAFQSFCHKKG